MAEVVGKARIHELPTLSENTAGIVLLASKEQTEYQLPIEKLAGGEVTLSSSANNILKAEAEGLFVDGTHPVIPKVFTSSLTGVMSLAKSLPDGSRLYKTTLSIKNQLNASALGGIGIFTSATIYPQILYLSESNELLDVKYYVADTSTKASTVTLTILVTMPKAPGVTVDINSLEETPITEEQIPVKLVAKLFVGTVLSQNGMTR
ncbi:hypothetical protein ACKWOP_16805 [Escherichia coli]|uniref:hypothetical protein n=1 Tax=Escherichia coli TaxID=562 RepID=UPI003904C2AA